MPFTSTMRSSLEGHAVDSTILSKNAMPGSDVSRLKAKREASLKASLEEFYCLQASHLQLQAFRHVTEVVTSARDHAHVGTMFHSA